MADHDFPYLVEIAGVAGAGKSTLARLLCQQDAEYRLAEFIDARRREHLAYIAHGIPRVLPILAANLGPRPRLDRRQIKLLVYATEWHRLLSRKPLYRRGVTLLDQGPIYALVRLKALGARVTTGAAFDRWWDEMIDSWSDRLGAIVWLDADDQVLWDRINGRDQRHATKGGSPEVGLRFITRYRLAFQQVLDRLGTRGPQIMRFDTGRASSEEIAGEIRVTLAARRVGLGAGV